MAQGLRIAIVAIAYYVTGKLGLTLAIPPGYATAVWPPSGIALAAVLLMGRGIWPGIVIGSFLINVPTGFDASTSQALLRSLSVPLLIGCSAALQAVVGGHWVQRYGRFPNALVQLRQVATLLAFGGLASCLINASVSVTLLFLTGVVAAANVPFTWATWWAGDAMGVFIFTPLAIVWCSRPWSAWRGRRLPITLSLATAFTLTVLMAGQTAAFERKSFQRLFDDRALSLVAELKRTAARDLETIDAAESFVASTAEPDRQSFSTFASQLLADAPGIQALEWAPRVSLADRAAFESSIRGQGIEGFEIKQLEGSNLVRAGERPEYFPALFIAPLSGNEAAAGFDLASSSDRLATLQQAGIRGRTTVSKPVQLVHGGRAVLAVSPVWAPASDSTAASAGGGHGRNLRGYAVGVIRMSELVNQAFRDLHSSGIEYWLLDDAPGAPALVVDSNTAERPGDFVLAEHGVLGGPLKVGDRLPFAIGGRRWTLQARPTQDFIAAYRLPSAWAVLIIGWLFSSLLAAFVMIATGREHQLRALVDERTAELRDSEQQFRRLMDGVVDCAIYTLTIDGHINSWNAGAERVKGYSAEEVVGSHFSLFYTAEDQARDLPSQTLIAALREGHFEGEGWCIRRDGSRFWGDRIVDPIYDDRGRHVGFSKVTRDITQRHAAAMQLQQTLEHLKLANQELESFSYSVAHDLRTPLRAVDGFAKILHDQYASKLDANAEYLIDVVRENARKMGVLIDELLALSRIGRRAMRFGAVNMAELFEEAKTAAEAHSNGKAVELVMTRLPAAWGDRELLRQVAANLMSNAIKFSSRRERPLIRITAKEFEEEIVYSVEDNGAGFDMKHADKLFNVFHRLHHQDEFPGTGVGLAIVHRIVTMHEGRLWATGQVGVGATFFFALPRDASVKKA